MSLAKLSAEAHSTPVEYINFSDWYTSSDGVPYAVQRKGDVNRQPFLDPVLAHRIKVLIDTIYAEMSDALGEAKELINNIQKQTQPPCMHRLTRYLDVQVTSIGALKWRGNLPIDVVP